MKIKFRDKEIDCKNKETILEAFKREKIKTFFMCQEGYCSTCKLTLEEGQVEYIEEPIAILDKNEILPCICLPKTDIKLKE
jgi:ferredoxin